MSPEKRKCLISRYFMISIIVTSSFWTITTSPTLSNKTSIEKCKTVLKIVTVQNVPHSVH